MPRHLMKNGLVAVVYFVLALLALEFPFLDAQVGRIVWPASGFALAALLLHGLSLAPGVALGAFAATALTSGPIVHSLATAAGNTIEVLVVASVLRRLHGFDCRFERVRDVLALIGLAVAVGAPASASFGVWGMYLGELAPTSALPRIWWMWALGHAMGLIIVSPFLLTVRDWPLVVRDRSAALESVGLTILLVFVCPFAFWSSASSRYPLEYLPFPLLVWAAYRFTAPGAATSNLLLSSLTIWGTTTGLGPFAVGTTSENLLFTWIFVNVSAMTTLLLAAVVAEGRRAEERHRKSERQYRLLIEQAADGIIIADENGRLTDVNTLAGDMLGYSRVALLTMSIEDLVVDSERASVIEELSSLARGRSRISSWTMRRTNGSGFPADVSAKRLDDGRLQAFVRDVTERRTLEAQLHQSQKMEAVGLLAGGIAHDFNNLITAIIGHINFAQKRLPPEHAVRADVEEVGKAASRAAHLTRQLLAFARKQIVEPKVVVFDDLVQGLEHMLRRVLGEDVVLEYLPSRERWHVKVDPVQLEQVVLNVAINAGDAMPSGGRLRLESAAVRWPVAGQQPDFKIPRGDYAGLTVTDTGAGMDSRTLPRIFEPFFTTKDRSQGTGLGLAVSYGIVKQAGGYIWATSEPGAGSSFHILFPRSEEEVDPLEEALPADRVATLPGGETILLIEDEPLVREVAEEVLHLSRYKVLSARNGEEALAIARRHPEEIHLTVTDVVLPAMSGKEVARRLKETRPGLKVLFMSGYAEEQVVHQGIVDENVAFLSKPFTPDDLAEKVRGVLDQR